MKTRNVAASLTVPPLAREGNSTKLVSLLALAAGAAAIPQSGQADIIYTNLVSPVSVSYSGITNFELAFPGNPSLPGNAHVGFAAKQIQAGNTYYRSVAFRNLAATDLAVFVQGKSGFALHRSSGAAWNDTYNHYPTIKVGKATQSLSGARYSPNSYSSEYLSYYFVDGDQNKFYGWVKVSLSNESSGDPTVTIYGYAYDTSGNPIATGAVPEPSTAAILALGALTLGAKGVRSWRRQQAAARKS